jgi:hypothetical protein
MMNAPFHVMAISGFHSFLSHQVSSFPTLLHNVPVCNPDAVERFFEDLLAPTPVGEEPKAVKAAKAVTWFAVIVLVVIEIGVSIKTGGMPFDGDRQAGLPTPAAVQETAE